MIFDFTSFDGCLVTQAAPFFLARVGDVVPPLLEFWILGMWRSEEMFRYSPPRPYPPFRTMFLGLVAEPP